MAVVIFAFKPSEPLASLRSPCFGELCSGRLNAVWLGTLHRGVRPLRLFAAPATRLTHLRVSIAWKYEVFEEHERSGLVVALFGPDGDWLPSLIRLDLRQPGEVEPFRSTVHTVRALIRAVPPSLSRLVLEYGLDAGDRGRSNRAALCAAVASALAIELQASRDTARGLRYLQIGGSGVGELASRVVQAIGPSFAAWPKAASQAHAELRARRLLDQHVDVPFIDLVRAILPRSMLLHLEQRYTLQPNFEYVRASAAAGLTLAAFPSSGLCGSLRATARSGMRMARGPRIRSDALYSLQTRLALDLLPRRRVLVLQRRVERERELLLRVPCIVRRIA